MKMIKVDQSGLAMAELQVIYIYTIYYYIILYKFNTNLSFTKLYTYHFPVYS
jgi:hypothetical protein